MKNMFEQQLNSNATFVSEQAFFLIERKLPGCRHFFRPYLGIGAYPSFFGSIQFGSFSFGNEFLPLDRGQDRFPKSLIVWKVRIRNIRFFWCRRVSKDLGGSGGYALLLHRAKNGSRQ